MKKFTALMSASVLALALTACGNGTTVEETVNEAVNQVEEKVEEKVEEVTNTVENATTEVTEKVEEVIETVVNDADPSAKSEGSMTYAEYVAAELDSEVVVEGYVQAKQAWWSDKLTFYIQDGDGAYYVYELGISEADAANLTVGTKVKVTGFKSEWSGEVEVIDATYEVLDGYYVADAKDITNELITNPVDFQNQFVSISGYTVVASTDLDGNEVPYLYNWDGSGSHDANSDIYFMLANGDTVLTFTVESYHTDNTTEVYAAVEALEIGQTVNVEGFLYWYNGPQMHVTCVEVQ